MILKYQGRDVEVEVSGSPDEAMIESGTFVDTGEEADESVLDALQNDYAGEIAMEATERLIGQAEAFFEGDR